MQEYKYLDYTSTKDLPAKDLLPKISTPQQNICQTVKIICKYTNIILVLSNRTYMISALQNLSLAHPSPSLVSGGHLNFYHSVRQSPTASFATS